MGAARLAALACAAVSAAAVALAGPVERRRRAALPLEVGRPATTLAVAGPSLARG